MSFTRNEYHAGPANAVDRLIDRGMDAREIAERLDVERWAVIERFAVRLWMLDGVELTRRGTEVMA